MKTVLWELTDRNHLEQSQERMVSKLKAPPPMLRSVRCVPAYDVVSGDTYLKNRRINIIESNKKNMHAAKVSTLWQHGCE